MAPTDISKILIGNKCDLYEERQVEEERGRKVLTGSLQKLVGLTYKWYKQNNKNWEFYIAW